MNSNREAIPNILTIAGSDPSGGAGIQADLKTITALGGYGMAVITALTAQNTQGVQNVYNVPAGFVADQIQSIFEDIHVAAVKIGMVGSAQTAQVIADMMVKYVPDFIVLDPVMVATSGDALIDEEAQEILIRGLSPLATILTPNLQEAALYLGGEIYDQELAAKDLLRFGSQSVLLKGGHKPFEKGSHRFAKDVLAIKNEGGEDTLQSFNSPYIETKNTHGTGCTLSSAMATFLGYGCDIKEACVLAKNFVSEAIKSADDLNIGKGHGPLNHLYKIIPNRAHS